MLKSNIKSKLLLVTDVFFVMLLCFAVLFATMHIENSSSVMNENGYVVSMKTFIPVLVCILSYLVFVCKNSIIELKSLVQITFDKTKNDCEELRRYVDGI